MLRCNAPLDCKTILLDHLKFSIYTLHTIGIVVLIWTIWF